MSNPKLVHEPALNENGDAYQPYLLDDSGDLYAYRGFVCRWCHAYYADPDAPPLRSFEPFPKLSATSVCPARLYEALKETKLLTPG